jgi:Raf kinase inhibitor-like YbhB/YbcL family protein
MFPNEFRNDAFVAMHGSWNRKPSSGYEVLRLRFSPGGDFLSFEPFITGFLVPQPDQAPPLPGAQPQPPDGYLARPTGITVAKDGALLVGDDSNNVIYRVKYGNAGSANFPQQLAGALLQPKNPSPITVQSRAFAPGGAIPIEYTDYGKGISPPLSWSGAPAGTKAFVVMMEDPDAKSPLPFVHWTAVLPANVTSLPENVPPIERHPALPNASQGTNSRSTLGYFGPRPPAGSPPHSYHFQVFALDAVPNLPSGYNRHALLKAMQGHVLARGDLVGKFARAP